MSDLFRFFPSELSSPGRGALAVVPSDTAALTTYSRALYVGETGDLRVRMVSGDTVTFANVQGGTFCPLRVSHVLATGTTANNIVAIF